MSESPYWSLAIRMSFWNYVSSFGGEAKPSVPCRRFTARRRTLQSMREMLVKTARELWRTNQDLPEIVRGSVLVGPAQRQLKVGRIGQGRQPLWWWHLLVPVRPGSWLQPWIWWRHASPKHWLLHLDAAAAGPLETDAGKVRGRGST